MRYSVYVVLLLDRVYSTNILAVLSSQSATARGPRTRALHLAPPVYAANASAHRCIGSALSQSPARSGHNKCMRKIFDDPLRPLSLQQRPEDVIYPSLPNVSRQLQPLGKLRQGRDAAPDGRLQGCLSTTHHDGDRDTRTELIEDLDVHLNAPMLKDGTANMHDSLILEEMNMLTNEDSADSLHSHRHVSDMCNTLGFRPVTSSTSPQDSRHSRKESQ